MQNLLGIISFAGFIAFVAAFSSGVPPTASVCKQMLPGHHSTLLTTTPECFLNVSSVEIKSGNALTVTLTAVGENVFKGYYIQARNGENTPIGTFTPTEITKAHSCGGIRNNAAHHSGNAPKKSVPIVWKAPAKYTGTVTFLASCVKDYSNYWIGIKSSPVKIEHDSSLEEIDNLIQSKRRKRGFQGARIMNKPLRESGSQFVNKPNQDTASEADTVITGWEPQTTNDGSLPVRRQHAKHQHQFTSVATIWKGKPNTLTTATKAVDPASNTFQPLKKFKIIHTHSSRPVKLPEENSPNLKYPGSRPDFQGGYGGGYLNPMRGSEAVVHPGSQAAHAATNYNIENHNAVDNHGHGYIPKEKFVHPKPEKGFQPIIHSQNGYGHPTYFQSVITPGADFHRNPPRPFPYEVPREVEEHLKGHPGHQSFHLPRMGYLVFNPRRGPPFYIITVPEPHMNPLNDMFNVYEYHPGNYRFGRRRPMMPYYKHA